MFHCDLQSGPGSVTSGSWIQDTELPSPMTCAAQVVTWDGRNSGGADQRVRKQKGTSLHPLPHCRDAGAQWRVWPSSAQLENPISVSLPGLLGCSKISWVSATAECSLESTRDHQRGGNGGREAVVESREGLVHIPPPSLNDLLPFPR